MIAILGGSGAAFAWALSTLCSSRSSRLIDPASVVAWVLVTGLVVTLPWALAQGVPPVSASTAAWLVLGGAGNVGGLMLGIRALRGGKVGIVAPIVSTEGAVAAMLAAVTGEPLGLATGVLLIVIAAGVVLAGRPADEGAGGGAVQPALLASAAALMFGASLLAVGRASDAVPLAWDILPARLIGALVVALPLAARGRLRLSRPAVPLVVTSGLCEVGGFAAYTVGARHGIAVAAVLGSLFGALSAVLAAVVFGERLARSQVAGVGAIAAGVAVLTAVHA